MRGANCVPTSGAKVKEAVMDGPNATDDGRATLPRSRSISRADDLVPTIAGVAEVHRGQDAWHSSMGSPLDGEDANDTAISQEVLLDRSRSEKFDNLTGPRAPESTIAKGSAAAGLASDNACAESGVEGVTFAFHPHHFQKA